MAKREQWRARPHTRTARDDAAAKKRKNGEAIPSVRSKQRLTKRAVGRRPKAGAGVGRRSPTTAPRTQDSGLSTRRRGPGSSHRHRGRLLLSRILSTMVMRTVAWNQQQGGRYEPDPNHHQDATEPRGRPSIERQSGTTTRTRPAARRLKTRTLPPLPTRFSKPPTWRST